MRPYDDFGSHVFSRDVMAQYLSKSAFKELVEVIDAGLKLSPDLADQVAHAMKEWALDHNAGHFTHWFQPMRGVTAEKHDSFLTIENGKAIDRFSGFQLIQSEPDASSFPSGGMRSTFEARGYTAWDPSSPAFLLNGSNRATLVIPSVYMSYTGEVLDLKTPLLRSLAAVEKTAFSMLKRFGNRTAKGVSVTVGPEQEYFLIDKEYFRGRLDLLLCGRTLLGAASPKLQQFEDHYFGSIKPNVLAFMEEVDTISGQRGIAFKTRHNEVAPNQFEIAPSFTDANLAVDHNLQLMEIMKQVADRHDFAILLHEKPFSGINGSGKHLNWSLQDSTGNNLLEPGMAPKRNVQFLVFLTGLLLGVAKYGSLLRAAVADAGNDHRLGANEAPPAIISVFIGGYIRQVLSSIRQGKDIEDLQEASLDLKVRQLPGVHVDSTDRNRTSPVAFTGNKFEFRAVGSSLNISEPTTVLNMITAAGLEIMEEKIEKYMAEFGDIKKAALAAVKEGYEESRDACFEGNNYDEAWHAEAANRNLPLAKNTPEALKIYLQPEMIALYEKYEILTAAEVHARVEVKREQYVKIKLLELGTLREISKTMVIPVLVAQLENFATTAMSLADGAAKTILERRIKVLEDLFVRIDEGLAEVKAVVAEVEESGDLEKEAEILGEKGCEILEKLRMACDETETEVEAAIWPLPKYSDMLHKL